MTDMKMRAVHVLLVLLVAGSLFAPLPSAKALPKFGHDTEYYDCNVSWVGSDIYDCFSHYYSGQQYGCYKYDEYWPCDGIGEGGSSWYYWNGTNWVPMSGPPCGPPYC